MRIDRFAAFAVETYKAAPEVLDAEHYSTGDRPHGISVKLAGGGTVRHAITRVRYEGEDLSAPEEPVTGEPAEPIEPRPGPDKPAALLASVLAGAKNPEIARVYAYGPESQHPGLAVHFHNQAKIHMLLL